MFLNTAPDLHLAIYTLITLLMVVFAMLVWIIIMGKKFQQLSLYNPSYLLSPIINRKLPYSYSYHHKQAIPIQHHSHLHLSAHQPANPHHTQRNCPFLNRIYPASHRLQEFDYSEAIWNLHNQVMRSERIFLQGNEYEARSWSQKNKFYDVRRDMFGFLEELEEQVDGVPWKTRIWVRLKRKGCG